MATVTADALALADQLIEALAKKDRKAVAQVLSAWHDSAVSCAIVRAEREFELQLRKQLRLPDTSTSEE